MDIFSADWDVYVVTPTVVSGLTTEDQLITSWSANLREGAEVSIQKEKSATAEDAGDEE